MDESLFFFTYVVKKNRFSPIELLMKLFSKKTENAELKHINELYQTESMSYTKQAQNRE
jgi:hypothetical protein